MSRPSLLLFASLVLGGCLFACSGSKDATEASVVVREEEGPAPTPEAARTALNEALQAYNGYCLTPVAEARDSYPITLVNPNARTSTHQYRELWALTQVGLLDTTATTSAGGLPVHQFDLTEKGRQSRYDIAQGRGYRRMFCYAVPVVTQLDSIKSIYNSGPNPLARVWFSYGYTDLGSWRNADSIRRTFSGLDPLPTKETRRSTRKLLVQVDSAWVDRRLTGYERPPKRPDPPTEQ